MLQKNIQKLLLHYIVQRLPRLIKKKYIYAIYFWCIINFIISSDLIVKVPTAVTFAQRTCCEARRHKTHSSSQNLSVGRINCIHNFNDHIVFKLLYCMSEVHLDRFIHTEYCMFFFFESDFKVNIMNITFFVKWKFVNIHYSYSGECFVYYCGHEMANVLCNLCC